MHYIPATVKHGLKSKHRLFEGLIRGKLVACRSCLCCSSDCCCRSRCRSRRRGHMAKRNARRPQRCGRRWGEALLIQATLVATAAGFLAISLASTLTTFLLAIGWFTLVTALLAPSVSALTSRRATLEQGITMGLSNAAQSLGRIAGPLLGGIAFDLYIEYPNYLGAAVMVAGFLISLLLLKEQRPIKSILSDSGRFP